MTSLALIRPLAADGLLASQIRAFIAQYLKVDADSISPRSHLAYDLGLDLLDIAELMIALEERFCVEEEVTDKLNQIEFVTDLVHYIEGSRRSQES